MPNATNRKNIPTASTPVGYARLALLVGLALGCYLAARYPMGVWTIDDAGISYSYARSIVTGEGSTVFAEGMPVEGFSNPLSVAIYAFFLWLGLFHPLLTHICLAAECGRLAPFQFHPLGHSSLVTTPGNLYRQGFLVRSPSRAGRYPVVVEVLEDELPILRVPLGEISVDTTLGGSPLAARLRPGAGPFLGRAFLLAQLERQARPRLARAEYRSLLDRYREAARSHSWRLASLYERLASDGASAVHPALREELDALEVALRAELEAIVERARARSAKRRRAGAQQRAATLIFNLRRLGFRDLGRTPSAAALRERIRGELERDLDAPLRYRNTLLLVAIEPREVASQKALLQLRDELLEPDRAEWGWAPAFYQAPKN